MNFEPVPLFGLLAAGVLYSLGVHRLAVRKRAWPVRRTASFVAGLMVIAVATLSPIESYDTRLFSVHVIQHLLLSMFAPLLLCLAAPITLFLQAVDRVWQRRALKVLHSRVVRVVTFPVTSWLLFSLTLFILLFSGLYELSLRNSLVHDLVHTHYLAAGFLFFAPVVAIDPHPWRMPHGARMLYVGLTLPVHAFLALALMTATKPLAAGWYSGVLGRPISDVLTDQKLGATLMWVTGDMLALATVAVVVMQWVREDERSANREDRSIDQASEAARIDEPAVPAP